MIIFFVFPAVDHENSDHQISWNCAQFANKSEAHASESKLRIEQSVEKIWQNVGAASRNRNGWTCMNSQRNKFTPQVYIKFFWENIFLSRQPSFCQPAH